MAGELNQLGNPRGVTVDPQGNIYVADGGYGRIQKWAPGCNSRRNSYSGLKTDLIVFL